MKGKTEINVSSILQNQINNKSRLKNFILNINVKTPKILSNLFLYFICISFIALTLATLAIIQQLQDLQIQVRYIDFSNRRLTF